MKFEERFDLTDETEKVSTILTLDVECQMIALDQQDIDDEGNPIDDCWSTVVLTPEQLAILIGIMFDRTDPNWFLEQQEERYSVH